jgi:AcrR family transcriptional regulator
MATSRSTDDGAITQSSVPDPSLSLFREFKSAPDAPRGRAWVGQHSRRSDIYAAARALLQRAGYDGVQMQAIAAQCNISPQTIYNLVGSKAQVLEQAAADWVHGIHVAAVARSRALHADAAFLMIEMFWESALTQPEWVRMSSRYSSTPRDPLTRAYYRAAESALRDILEPLKSRGSLRTDVDVCSLARQLTAIAHATITRWCAEPGSVDDYRRDLISGPGAMLRASLQGETLAALERYITERYSTRPTGRAEAHGG